MKGRRILRTALSVAVFFCTMLQEGLLRGQTLPDEIGRVLEAVAGQGGDYDQLYDYLQWRYAHPLDINKASAQELERLPLMTPYMVQSIVDYREQYGAIVSYSELSLVGGFDDAVVQDLRPFICFGTQEEARAQQRKVRPYRQKLILRTKATVQLSEDGGESASEDGFRGLPVSLYAKYSAVVYEKYSTGLLLETDRGERTFPDHYSMFISAADLRPWKSDAVTLESVVVGDYSLRFGQGMALWNGFSLSGLADPSAACRNPLAVTPRTSSDENDYFHGAAATVSFDRAGVSLSAAYSYNRLDARIEDGRFVTLPQDGVHDSESLEQARNTLGEHLVGLNLNWQNSFLRIGATAALYRYTLPDGRRKSYYNEHLRYDGWWGNYSADFLLSYRGVRVFGELALDSRAAFATVVGAVAPLWADAEGVLIYRYYDPYYIATHSGAYCASDCNNEHGVTASLKWSPRRQLVLRSQLAYTHFPYHRYGVRGASDQIRTSLEADWTLPGRSSRLFFRSSYNWDTGRETSTAKLRADYRYTTSFGLECVTRAECTLAGLSSEPIVGVLLYQEVSYTGEDGLLSCSARVTLFSAKDWESRVYCYERDLAGSFYVPAYYGEGLGVYGMVTYKPLNWLHLSLKCSAAFYKDSSRDVLKVNAQVTVPF